MSALLIAGAVITCIKGCVEIAQSFRKESIEQVVGSGHGTGFWDFYSFSSVGHLTTSAAKAPKYVTQSLIPKVMKVQSKAMQKYKAEITSELQDIADFADFEIGGDDRVFTSTSYNANKGMLFFYVYTFEPVKGSNGANGVKISTMRMEIEMQMAKDWMLVNRMESSFTKAKNTFELQYLPTGITASKVIDAIAVAFAPVAIGLVEVPEKFLTVMESVIKSSASELPQYTSESMKDILAAWENVCRRQTEKDALTIKGIETIGEGIASIAK